MLALALAAAAPAGAFAAHRWLGLSLKPGQWVGWGGGAAGGSVVWFWVWVLGLAPVIEEFCMRFLLQTGLRHQLGRLHADGPANSLDWRGHLANAVVALVFAMLHLPANDMLALWWLVPALAVGEVWRRSSSWGLCALLHAWFNASLAAVTLLGSL